MQNKDLKELIGDLWPKTETLDNPADSVAAVHSVDYLSEDAQNLTDWMRRVQKNYPELYISEEDNKYDSKSQNNTGAKK